MNGVQIRVYGGRVLLKAPYHPEVKDLAYPLHGRWRQESRAWEFDGRDEEKVRQLARDVYGTDGSQPAKLVDVRLDLGKLLRYYRSSAGFYFLGRMIAERQSRDGSPRLGDGVVIVEGGFASRGGSNPNPRLEPTDGTVLEVRDVPVGHVDLSDPAVTVLPERPLELPEPEGRIRRIRSQAEWRELYGTLPILSHEPDQEGVSAEVRRVYSDGTVAVLGNNLDTCGFWPHDVTRMHDDDTQIVEYHVLITKEGEPVAAVNLLMLMAWAADDARGAS